jgi:hypothetical protein
VSDHGWTDYMAGMMAAEGEPCQPREIWEALGARDRTAIARAAVSGRVSGRVSAARRRRLWDLGLTDNADRLTPAGWAVARCAPPAHM